MARTRSGASGRRSSGTTKIAALRHSRGISQATLSRRSQVPKRTIERLEHGGVVNPGIRTLLALAAALDAPLRDLIEEDWVPVEHYPSLLS